MSVSGGQALPEAADGVDGEGRAGAFDLHVRDRQPGVAFDGQLDHPQAVFRRGHPGAPLVRRDGGRDEEDLVQAKPLLHLQGRPQVPEVDRIEGSPKQSYPHK